MKLCIIHNTDKTERELDILSAKDNKFTLWWPLVGELTLDIRNNVLLKGRRKLPWKAKNIALACILYGQFQPIKERERAEKGLQPFRGKI